MTPAQLRAARGLLDWSRRELNAASGVSVDTLKNIETVKFTPQETTAEKLLITLAAHGVELIGSRYVQGVVMVLKDKVSVAERMATAVTKIMREQGGCLPKNLLTKGFTDEEIDRHWAMANALAKIELNIMDS
jgi:transcriptional regulator with XRE-family HTH domain